MKKPTFLVIGAHRAGTTSLYWLLSQHPQIYMSPIKETNYFAYDNDITSGLDYYPIRTWDDYLLLFSRSIGKTERGEVSPEYLINPNTPARVREKLPDIKLVACIREPVERAYSHYAHEIRNGQRQGSMPPDLRDIDEQQRWIRVGFYAKHLKRYYDAFDRSQIKVILFDELRDNGSNVSREIFEFLNIDENFNANMKTNHNKGGIPKNKLLFSFLRSSIFGTKLKTHIPQPIRATLGAIKSRILDTALVQTPPLSPDVACRLQELYRDDVTALQDIIQKDLSIWLNHFNS